MTPRTSTARIWHTTMPSSLGELTLVREAGGVRGLYFPHHWYQPDPASFGPASDDGFADAIAQIGQYLAGTRRDFDLPMVEAGDDLQRRVWERVKQIGYGRTTTYGELANQFGGDVTAQQVGSAVGRNPLCVLIPCHRVLGRGGKLTGYAGGLARKQHLLELESEHLPESVRAPAQHALMTGLW